MWKWMILLCVAFSAHLSAATGILVFLGINSEDSVNEKLVIETINVARQMGTHVNVINLKDYAELEAKKVMPEKGKELRQLIIQSQEILIASPTHNDSVSTALKNVINWSSRSEGGSPSLEIFKDKKITILSSSFEPNHDGLTLLRNFLESRGAKVSVERIPPDFFQFIRGEIN